MKNFPGSQKYLKKKKISHTLMEVQPKGNEGIEEKVHEEWADYFGAFLFILL